MGRHSYAAGDVATDADASAARQQRRLAARRAAGRITLVVRVHAAAPDVVGALVAEQGNGQVGLDVWDSAGVFEQAHHGPVDRVGCFVADEGGVADCGVETAYDDGVFETDGDASEGTPEVDFFGVLEGVLGGGDEDLGQAVGSGVGFDGDLAVGLEDGERRDGIGLDAGHELGDGLVDGVEVLAGQRGVVFRTERGDAFVTLGLLGLAI